METLIFKPYCDDIDGSLQYGTGTLALKVRYDIRQRKRGIYKLCMLSSIRPMNVPVNVHTLMPAGDVAVGEKEISFSELSFWGYDKNDIDTFVVYKKEKTGNIPVSACFCRLVWDFFKHPFFVSGVDDSILSARNTLERLKCAPNPERYKEVLCALNDIKKTFVPVSDIPLEDFFWCECSIDTFPFCESAYEHLISCQNGQGLLLGVGKDGLTAVASRTKNVFRNVDDCITYKNGYYVVGVLFAEEGQYFARLE